MPGSLILGLVMITPSSDSCQRRYGCVDRSYARLVLDNRNSVRGLPYNDGGEGVHLFAYSAYPEDMPK